MRKALMIAIVIVLCAILGICVWQIVDYIQETREGEELYDNLAAMMEQAAATEEPAATPVPRPTSVPAVTPTLAPNETLAPYMVETPTDDPNATAAPEATADAQATEAPHEDEPQTWEIYRPEEGDVIDEGTPMPTPHYDATPTPLADTPKPYMVTPTPEPGSIAAAPQETAEPVSAQTTASPLDGVLPEYRAFVELNLDTVGWISIEGTPVNYPVVQRLLDDEYYVHRDFLGNEVRYGCVFAQGTADVKRPSDNIVIYGHNMRNNSMFGSLDEYKEFEYLMEHPTFRFDTIWEKAEYEIFAVFKTYVYSDSPRVFKYYQFVDAKDEADFDQYIERCRSLSVHDIDTEVEYGDKIVMLSTCEYSQANGRIVIAGRRIEEEDRAPLEARLAEYEASRESK